MESFDLELTSICNFYERGQLVKFELIRTATDSDVLIAYLEWDTAIPGFTKSINYK